MGKRPGMAGRRNRWSGLRFVGVLLAALGIMPARLDAHQSRDLSADPLGEIAGRVIDADSREPLQGATVLLEGLPPPGTANGTGSVPERLAVTGPQGSYRFSELARSRYKLSVSRIGYRSATIEIDLRQAAASRLSVGLENDPIALEPLSVVGGRPEPYGRLQPLSAATSGGARLIDELRQARYLVSDTRELTHADVVSAVTLAETDLFRALQRVPGVSTRDDYTATMWTRGATWDQTRVYFDGLPLYNPTHAGWLFAAVNPDGVASASFHPGFRSARWGEGAAGVLDLRSRSGGAGRTIRGTGEVSLSSTRLALDGELGDTGIGWMIAARRSYIDLLSAVADGIAGRDDLRVPYDFMDIVARLDAELGKGWQLQASSILEYDHLRGDIKGLLEGNRGRWGNRLGRAAVTGPLGALRGTLAAGGTNFGTLIFEREDEPGSGTLPTLENAIAHRMISFEIEPAGGAVPRDWVLGVQIMRDSVSYDGPFSLIGALTIADARDPFTETPFTYGSALTHAALWGEKRWALGSRVDVLSGLRAEVGDSVWNGGRVRLAPRLAVRVEPMPGSAVTGSWSRSFQYTQDVSPAAGPIGPQLHLSAIWVLASPAAAFPAVRTDLATLGVEREWGEGWSVMATVYDRRSSGLKIPNPLPGAITVGREPDAVAANAARGIELNLRRTTGRWTGSLGYAWGTSTLTSDARPTSGRILPLPSSADIEHGFDATGLMRIGDDLRLGGAFTYGSGVPFTRLVIGDGTRDGPRPRLGDPNAERTPTYASLDLMMEYERRFGGWAMSGYLQIRNVANRNNSVTYAGSWDCPAGGPVGGSDTFRDVCRSSTGITDRFEHGLPRLPLIGFRIAF